MAALPAGDQYGLSSESCCEDNKELVFVNLTDSAMKAIENFLSSKGNGSAKPKIQFLPGNEGKISIPTPNSDIGLTSEATFQFSINSNAEMEGGQGSFECITSGGARRMESCGPLQRRMRVHAIDDSYVATGDRMASAFAAEQNKCTRMFDEPHQTDIVRRVNVRTAHPYSRFDFDFTDLAERAERAQRPEKTVRPERVQRPVPQATRPQRAPASASHRQYAQPQRLPAPKSGLTRRPIKERLIHILALRAFNKLEIYSRLSCEGIRDVERSSVKNILPIISTFKGNCYHLKTNIWNVVKEDWPFYSEEEKVTVKRRKHQNQAPALSSDSATPRASPSASKRPSSAGGQASRPAGGARSPSTARGGAAAAASVSVLPDEPPHKKRRISHYRRPSPPSSGYATTSSGERQAEDKEDERINTASDILPPVHDERLHHLKTIPISSWIQTQYPPITSSETRRAYKDEFARLFPEYSSLHRRLRQVVDRFTILEDAYRNAHPLAVQSAERRIYDEYARIKNETSFDQDKRCLLHLHSKLAHIKLRVSEYDNKQE